METTSETNLNPSLRASFCTACGASLTEHSGARFCPMCGKAVFGGAGAKARHHSQRLPLEPKQWAIVFFVALVIFVPTLFYTRSIAGKVPTETVVRTMDANDAAYELPAKFKPVQDAALKSPNDLKAQNAYAAVLVDLIRESNEPAQGLVLEAVEQLSKILAINPLEPDALLALADISFNQQIFDKAASLYERFLALRPADEDVRTRYGSALMFKGDFDKSIEQQKSVLAKNPKNFQATAYLAIAIGQKGDIKQARITARKALELAPNDEAKKRLQAFVDSLDKKQEPKDDQSTTVKAGDPQARQATGAVAPGGSPNSLENALRSNPVAGSKVSSVSIDSGVATVKMHDFPMQAMPPYAKEKFYTSLSVAAKSNQVKTIIFIDETSGRELERKDF